MSADIKLVHSSNVANNAEQELLDYLVWSMKYDVDPHELFEDPIEAFRKEMKVERIVA